MYLASWLHVEDLAAAPAGVLSEADKIPDGRGRSVGGGGRSFVAPPALGQVVGAVRNASLQRRLA